MELNHDLPDEVRRVITTGTYSEENLKCVDCGTDDYEWCSLSFGVFVCLVCAGFHRSLGTHITTVRSMKLDSISSYQLDIIRHGGNHKFREYLRTCRYVSETTPIEEKYVTPEVLYYREILSAKVEGRVPIPRNDEIYNDLSKKYSSNRKITNSSIPTWIEDTQVSSCMICSLPFTFTFRRHHCRRCGRCICSKCAPKDNTRPIPEWGLKEPVRHCKTCYRSPALEWD